jgi:hypothetical protein
MAVPAVSAPGLITTRTTVCAWTLLALASALPDIVLAETTGIVPRWLPWSKLAAALVVAAVSTLWRPLRPLRRLSVVLVAFFGLHLLFARVDFTWFELQRLLGATPFDARMQAEQVGKLAITLGMIVVLVLLGLGRTESYLTRGEVRAPIRPVRVLGFPRPEPWPAFGLQWSVYIAAALAVVLYLGVRPTGVELVAVLPMLPAVLFYASLNAFNEEVTYRAPLLATLVPAVGGRHALWLAAGFFGVAHYFGVPGGLGGAAASVFMGWILTKAMLETRGLFWSWWIHLVADIVIFLFLAVQLLR